ATVQLQLAQALAKGGRALEAITVFDKALAVSPRLHRAHVGKSQLFARALGKAPEALESARQASKISPADPEVIAALGTANLLNGNLEAAFGMLSDSVASQPDDGNLLLDLAKTTYGLGRVAEARARLEKLISASPAIQKEAETFLNLTAADNIGNSETKVLAANILAKDPKNIPALMFTAESKEREKEDPSTLYREIISIAPTFEPARIKLARRLAADSSTAEEAESLAMEARRRFPDDADLTGILGIVNFRRGSHSQAIRFLKELSAKRPLSSEEQFALGMSEAATNQPDQARTNLENALKAGLSDSDLTTAKAKLEELDK
ncbi:MAG: tetratricopeptide repeat protein, partial [Proteobacteria bacterium]